MSTAVCTVMCSEPAIRAPASGFDSTELVAQRHEPGHLVLGEADLVAARLGEREVGDLERECGVGIGEGGCVDHAVILSFAGRVAPSACDSARG